MSQNQTTVEIGRELWRSSYPVLLLKQGDLEQAARTMSTQLLNTSKDGGNTQNEQYIKADFISPKSAMKAD